MNSVLDDCLLYDETSQTVVVCDGLCPEAYRLTWHGMISTCYTKKNLVLLVGREYNSLCRNLNPKEYREPDKEGFGWLVVIAGPDPNLIYEQLAAMDV